MQRFVKGRTNNHLTFAMVDSTDFASPESAVSAATTIKIYGKVRGGTGVNFVTSGTGSLTNDIQHVGASALGIYTIALAKADLSDASNAWYDQYIIALSATGCARQTLVVDGGIDDSTILAMSAMLSDAHSAAILGASNASDAYSAALLIQSRLSDLDSRLTSDVSDVLSQLTVVQSMASDAASAATQGNSRVLLVQSRLSDLDSRLVSDVSDILSAIGAITVTLDASDISDIASATAVAVGSTISDIYSLLSDLNSNFHSRIPKEPSARSQVSDLSSDLLSYLTGMSGMLSDTHSAANVGASRALLNQSRISDVYSMLSDFQSDFGSRVPKEVAARSQLSDLASDILSDLHSFIDAGVTIGASSLSDIRSAITATELDASDLSDIASAVWARAGADPTAVIGVTASMGAKLDWLAAMSRNKLTQTATEQTLYRDDTTTVTASAVVSDDGTTASRGEFA